MEMCYDGALVMPSNYAVMSEDEMMYVDGGIDRTYKGSQGWAVAGALCLAGGVLAGMSSGVSKTIVSSVLAAAGPIAWIICGVTCVIMTGANAFAGQIIDAGRQAFYCMHKKGKFRLKATSNPFGLLSVS